MDSLRSLLVIAFAGCLLLELSGYFPSQQQTVYAQSKDVQSEEKSIAVVNGKNILYRDYLQALRTMKQQSGRQTGQLALKSRTLNLMINQELLLQKAKEDNLTVEVTDEEIEEQIDKLANKYSNSRAEFEKLLENEGLTLSGVKANLKSRLKEQRTLQKEIEKLTADVKVTDDEVSEAYKKATGKKATGDKFAQNRSKLKKRLRQEKKKQALDQFLKRYRDKSEIKINSAELRAFQAVQSDNLEKAVKDYKKAIKQDPKKAYLYSNLAQAYQKQGKSELALKNHKRAVNKEPKNVESRFALGNFYLQIDAKEKAVKEFDKVSKLAENNFLIHYRLQKTYEKLGYKERAQAERKKIQALQKEAAKQREKRNEIE